LEPSVSNTLTKPGKPEETPAVGAEVRLTRRAQHLLVEPPCAEVAAVLHSRFRLAAFHPAAGNEMRAVPIPLHQIEDQVGPPVLGALAGLELAVVTLLHQAGRPIRLLGRRPGPLPPASAPAWPLGGMDSPLLDCVRRCERAVLRYDGAMVDPAAVVAQIARAWPDSTVLVLVSRRDEAHLPGRRLRRLGVAADVVTGQNNPAEVGRVAVATYWATAHPPIRAEWRHIQVALDAVEAVGRRARWCFSYGWRARWYGLLDAAALASPLEQDLIREFFGFEEVYVPRHGYRETPVHVVFCPVRGGPPLPQELDGVGLKRQAVWRHPVRNRRVAALAVALRDSDHGRLRNDFSPVADVRAGQAPACVFVLVENVEHGLALSRLLAELPLVTGPSPAEHGLNAH
jgi:hypothetical protein